MKHKRLGDDRGLALPLALMAFVVLGALAAAILSIGGSEVQIASNHLRAIQAEFLAEAGLEHAFNTLRTTPNLVTNANATLQTLLSNPSLGGAGNYTVQYQAAGTNTVRVVATGASAIGGSQAIRRATMSTFFHSNDAILTDGTLTISGNPDVFATGGQCGNVHTNSNLTMSGNPDISGNATATGTYTASGNPHVGPDSGGANPNSTLLCPSCPRETVPHIGSADFLNIAITTLPANQIFQMKANGQVLDGAGNLLTTLSSGGSYRAWSYTSGTPAQWSLSGNTGYDGTYYFEGNVSVSGNPGSPTLWVTTLIATGDMTISGNARIQTMVTDTLFVAGHNITVSGNPSNGFNGLIAAHEQFSLSGNPTINGFLIAENAGGTSNTISGNPTINYNCDLNPPLQGPLQILSWGL